MPSGASVLMYFSGTETIDEYRFNLKITSNIRLKIFFTTNTSVQVKTQYTSAQTIMQIYDDIIFFSLQKRNCNTEIISFAENCKRCVIWGLNATRLQILLDKEINLAVRNFLLSKRSAGVVNNTSPSD